MFASIDISTYRRVNLPTGPKLMRSVKIVKVTSDRMVKMVKHAWAGDGSNVKTDRAEIDSEGWGW